ncbi:hypothetical protein K502DRAFT_232541 [Neoconidiobolus thromboides FSU 785]|nr:hypothetical protein K502DRAFT_232541 [Neoconidiobolus thromboides FSU 785]
MKDLFIYGSLQNLTVLKRVLSPKTEFTLLPATLKDYKRVTVKGALYPGIYFSDGELTEGKLFKNVTEEDIVKLDRFEGEDYNRTQIVVEVIKDNGSKSKEMAMVYTWIGGEEKLSNTSWSLETFEKEHLTSFINMECDSK